MNDDKKNINNNEINTSCDEQSQLDLKEIKTDEIKDTSKKDEQAQQDSAKPKSSFFDDIKSKSKNYDFTSVIITASAVVIAIIIVFAIFPACNINLLHNVYNSVSAKEILHVDENSTSADYDDDSSDTTVETKASDTAIKPTSENVQVDKTDTQVVYDEVISTSGKTATVNISNPGNNKYLESIRIYSTTDNTDIYYQSDIMKPGTGLVKITLSKSIGKKAIPVIVEFTFYDSDLTVLDTKMVGATLTPLDKVSEIEDKAK